MKTRRKGFGKILLWSMQFIAVSVFAQSPSLINYQGTARLADGTPLDNRNISIKFDLREGSSSGSIIATETQNLQTNALGLFSTLIGQNTNLSAINWQGTTMFLQVSMDTSGGNNFVNVGVQQLVSVPYAMHASSVPSSYTNNILSIGSNTYALSPTVAVVPNTSITVSGLGTVTSIGTNTFDINIPAPTFSNSGQTIITGTYPDFVVNTPTVPAAVTPSITLTNTAALTSTVVSSGSSFSLNVPPPTFSNTSQTIITGTYPDFIVNTPTVGATPLTTVSPQGLVTVSNPATNSFVVGVQSPTFTNIGQNIITGTYPNYSVNTPTVPVTPTVSAAGLATVSAGPNYLVGVQSPTFTNVGQTIITGTYPNYSVNTPTVPVTPTVSAAGLATVSAGPNYLVGVQSPTFTNVGQNIITGTYPNYSVNTPTVPVTPTVSAAGLATVSAGPNYLVGVQSPTFTNVGQTIITGTYPNYSVNTPTVPVTPTVSAAGLATVSAGPNYLVGVQSPTFNNVGQTIITGTYPNYAVNTPTVANTSIALTSTAAAGPSLTTSGTNSFNINIPPVTAWSLIGNAATSSATNFIGTSDNVALNFRVNNQQSGNIDPVTFNSSFGYQSGTSITTANGSAGFGYRTLFANTTGNNNSAFGYRALSANTIGGANSAFGSDALLSNTTGAFNVAFGLNAGRGNTAGNNNTALGRDALYNNSTGSGNIAIGYQAGFFETGSNKLFISNSSTSVTPLVYGDFSTGHLAIGTTTANGELQFNNTINGRKIVLWEAANNDHQVYSIGTNINTLRYQVDNSVADHAFFAGVNATTSQELMRIKGTGNVGIGTSTPNAPLQFANSIVNRKVVLFEVANNDHQYYGLGINNSTLRYQVATTNDDHVFYAGNGTTASNELMRVKGNGLLKMGSETGTGQGAQYPSTAGGGLLMRRLFTSITTAGEVVARTDQMTLERDGTSGGWRVNRVGGNGDEVCNCMGTNNVGVSVNRVFNNLAAGITQVYTNADNIVYFRCMFGDPYAASHITEVMFTRMHTDYFWVGTVTTTFNQ